MMLRPEGGIDARRAYNTSNRLTHMNHLISNRFAALLLSLACMGVHAEPTSGPVHVLQARPHAGDETAYIYIDNSTFCNSNLYAVSLTTASGKAMFAVALEAVATGKTVLVEVPDAGGCGTGTIHPLQSLYANPN